MYRNSIFSLVKSRKLELQSCKPKIVQKLYFAGIRYNFCTICLCVFEFSSKSCWFTSDVCMLQCRLSSPTTRVFKLHLEFLVPGFYVGIRRPSRGNRQCRRLSRLCFQKTFFISQDHFSHKRQETQKHQCRYLSGHCRRCRCPYPPPNPPATNIIPLFLPELLHNADLNAICSAVKGTDGKPTKRVRDKRP